MNILFVCTGNTCRSPMAEGFLNNMAHDCKISLNAFSRGIMVAPLSEVSVNSVKVMSEYGIDISNHLPKNITVSDMEKADLILTMTLSHSEILKNVNHLCESKVFSLGAYADTDDISDPYGGDYNEYKACAEQIKNGIISLIDKINSNYE